MLYPDVNMLRIFCLLGHGWGWQPLKGGCKDYNPPSLDNIVTYSVYIIIEVMYFVYISHILPHTWLGTHSCYQGQECDVGGFCSKCLTYMGSLEKSIDTNIIVIKGILNNSFFF